jgi:hypothetical protein
LTGPVIDVLDYSNAADKSYDERDREHDSDSPNDHHGFSYLNDASFAT